MKKLLSSSLISAAVCTALMALSACGQEPIGQEEKPAYPKAILKTWYEAREEKNYNQDGSWDGISIFRPSPPYMPPPSRFRQYYIFHKDYSCEYLVLAPNDGHYPKIGTWKYSENPQRIKIYDDKSVLLLGYEIIELTESILKVKYLNISTCPHLTWIN